MTALCLNCFCIFAGQLLVNFDKAMMQLIRETKHLQRMGIAVPESARQVLAQEEKFKIYFNQLTYALKVRFLQLTYFTVMLDMHKFKTM